MICGRKLGWLVLLMVLVPSLWLALAREKPATLLTNEGDWQMVAPPSSKVHLQAFPGQWSHFRASVVAHPQSVLFRTWTPDKGIVPVRLRSGIFPCWRYLSVAITGTNRTPSGQVLCFLERVDVPEWRVVFQGGVNVNGAEALMSLPHSWEGKPVRLVFESTETDTNVGVGSVFGIGAISYAKSSFFGRIPYFMAAFLVFSLVAVVAVSLTQALGWDLDPYPASLAGLGMGALGLFYVSSSLCFALAPADAPIKFDRMGWYGAGFASSVLVVVVLLILTLKGKQPVRFALRSLIPYLKVWFLVAAGYFALSGLQFQGNAHWEPNYRFWPASWSSDNELPWMFAEALHQGFPLKGLYGGGWLPTDRPPLMAGAHLMVADVFRLLGRNNDGAYLLGQAYNTSSLLLNTLWAPTLVWLVQKFRPKDPCDKPYLVLLFVGALPFVIFNSTYGWPKFFGAAMALTAFGQAWVSWTPERENCRGELLSFFALAALSMLAHESTALFLGPLGLFIVAFHWKKQKVLLMTGAALAGWLLGGWVLYKTMVLPSFSPVTRYALTGRYGFDNPSLSLFHAVIDHYRSLGMASLLKAKSIMLCQPFFPVNNGIVQIGLNQDFGTTCLDRLRSWDLMLLSKGNLLAFIFPMLASVRSQGRIRVESPGMILILLGVCSWLLMTALFFPPPMIPLWPMAALLGMAIAGASMVQELYPKVFKLGLGIQLCYTLVVWGISPIKALQSLDLAALATVIGLMIWAWSAFSRFNQPASFHHQ